MAPDEAEPAPPLDDPNHPTGRCGARAPHLPIEVDGRRASTLDLVGPGFTLLAGPDGEAWCQADTGPGADPTGRFTTTFGLSAAGAVLLRPDGIIAWRGDEPTEDRGERLRRVMTTLLAR